MVVHQWVAIVYGQYSDVRKKKLYHVIQPSKLKMAAARQLWSFGRFCSLVRCVDSVRYVL